MLCFSYAFCFKPINLMENIQKFLFYNTQKIGCIVKMKAESPSFKFPSDVWRSTGLFSV